MTDHAIQSVLARKQRHAMLEGDCLIVGKAIPDESIDSIIVDPPYGMSYRGLEDNRPPIANDERPFIWWLYDAHRVLKPGGALICFCQWRGQEDFRNAIRVAGLSVRNQLIWDRMNGGMGNTSCTFAPRHDVIWFATKGRGFRFQHGRPDSVLPVKNVPALSRHHSTQKPHDLMVKLARAVTPTGGVIYDPCAGSGSTGVAALAAGYRFIGVELDEGNCATARRRLREVSTVKLKLAGQSVHVYPMRRAVA